MRLCPGGDPADDVRGSDLRPPLDRRPRGRDLPQKDQICGGGPSGAAAGHVSALGPLPKHVLISHRTNPVSTPGTDASGSVLISFMLSCFIMYTSAGFALYYGGTRSCHCMSKTCPVRLLEELIVIYSI